MMMIDDNFVLRVFEWLLYQLTCAVCPFLLTTIQIQLNWIHVMYTVTLQRSRDGAYYYRLLFYGEYSIPCIMFSISHLGCNVVIFSELLKFQ